MKYRLLVLFLCVLANVSNVFSQDATATITPTTILIGDHMTLDLRATLKPNQKLIFPNINDSLIGNFRVVKKLKTDTLFSGNTSVVSQQFIITCFEDSIQTFPSLTFTQGLGNTIHTSPIRIQVNTINIDSAKDVKPIKNVIQVPLSKKELASYLFLSFVLLGLVLLIYFVYIKWIKKEELFDREKAKDPPHVIALKKLKDIENENLIEKGRIKDYYDQVSDTIREYIEKRFGIKAMEQTTPQILQAVKQLNLPLELSSNIEEILNLSDLAKFAKQTPSEENNKEILKKSYELVQQTQVQYDANKKADALKVKKFYAQNKYGIKESAINQETFRDLIYGLIATLLILSITIVIAYAVPLNTLLGYIADTPIVFFLMFIIIGVVITLAWVYIVRKRNQKYFVIFDFDSMSIEKGNSHKTILFKNIREVREDKKGNLIVIDHLHNKYNIPKNIEYYPEVKERIEDIIANESIQKSVEP